MHFDEVSDVADDGESNYHDNEIADARTLFMCEVMKIKIDPDCNTLYISYNELAAENTEWDADERKFLEFPEGLFQECLEWVKEQNKHAGNDIVHSSEYKPYRYSSYIQEMALKHNGFSSSFLANVSVSAISIEYEMAYVMAMMKMGYPSLELSFGELQTLATIYDSVTGLVDCVTNMNEFMDLIMNSYLDEYESVLQMLHIADLPDQKRKSEAHDSPSKPLSDNKDKNDYSVDDMTNELMQLREKLRMRDMEFSHLKQLYGQRQRTDAELKDRIAKYETEHEELIALRDHVFHSAESDIEPASEDMELMKKTIAEKSIIIVGGHTNWSGKLRAMFKKWAFVDAKVSGTLDDQIVAGADYVFFYTDYIQHSNYYKYMDAVRLSKVPFGYIHSTNIDADVRQIYEKTKER